MGHVGEGKQDKSDDGVEEGSEGADGCYYRGNTGGESRAKGDAGGEG
jgi:hypothetical protein